ncbi:MAG: alpha-N-acetylglucosaminidase [Sphingobacteriaceae bacterium]|jgi:alpha-N-acetylglucosaminidase|nr:alpha-N-acetylglucosaminidase [Sphingobacteriaceae bacterium]
MRKIAAAIFLLCLSGFHLSAQQVNVSPARDVIRRLIGSKADGIQIDYIPGETGNDSYLVTAKGGVLSISGSSPVAVCYGFNKYLQNACHSMITWSGKNLNIPTKWPDYSSGKVSSPYQYRYFLNVVTFGYTTPYWDWKRWEKELDWMALHGINMPLATVASEAIAARAWKKLGLSDNEISEFFTGPAHLPWHRMGNINKWDGPIPASWHTDQLKLQHQILDRMRNLGFEPIEPAFAGFVPEGFQKKHPELEVKRLTWGGFPAEYNAFVLAPNSPYFEQIGKLFVEEWEKEFGKARYYLSDSFNEMDVPVPKDDLKARYDLLSQYGESVYKSIKAGNPDAIWVTQGWTFGWQHDFWDKESLKALLKNVPDDKMVIIDLANEFPHYVWKIEQTWKKHEGFYGKKWIFSYVPNFGGKTPYVGDLEMYGSGAIEALHSPYSKNLIGFGSAPEGIENNEVIYELLADMGWSDKVIDLKTWIPDYCKARYSAYPAKMATAWQQLQQSAYSSFSSYPRFIWQTVTPDKRRKGGINYGPLFNHAVENFLDCSEELKHSQLYRNDAIELSMFYLGMKADEYYLQALHGDSIGNQHLKKAALAKVSEILLAADRLLESQPVDRLEPWVDFARSHGTTTAEKNYYEANAKRLITTWGGVNGDYAARIWSGLIRDYYLPRITKYLSGNKADLAAWEEAWIRKPGVSKVPPFADPVVKAKELVAKYR